MKVGRLRIGRPEVECIGEKPHRLPRVESAEKEEQEMAELKGRVHGEGRTRDKTKPPGLVRLAT